MQVSKLLKQKNTSQGRTIRVLKFFRSLKNRDIFAKIKRVGRMASRPERRRVLPMKKSSGIHLRPATAGNREFVYSVLKEASKEHVIETWGW